MIAAELQREPIADSPIKMELFIMETDSPIAGIGLSRFKKALLDSEKLDLSSSDINIDKDIYNRFDELFQAITSSEGFRFGKVCEKTEREFSKYNKYIEGLDVSSVKEQARKIAKEIASIQFKDLAVELTPFRSLKYTLIIDNSQLFTISKLLTVDDSSVVFSFFKDDECIFSDIIDLSTLTDAIKNYIATLD